MLFFDIVALAIYLALALLVVGLTWFDRKNAKLILPCAVFLAIGMAPVPGVVVVAMPFLVVGAILLTRETDKGAPFDYQSHLLALRDSGAISQEKFEEESARIKGHRG